MAAYQVAADKARTLEELVEVATEIYRADIENGHITLFAELVGAGIARPELREEIVKRAEPWIAFIEQTKPAPSSSPYGCHAGAHDARARRANRSM